MTVDEVIVPQLKRCRKPPAAPSNSVVLSSVGHSDDANSESVLHKRMLLGILDNCIGEMKARFGENNTGVLSAIVSLWPESEWFLEPENIKPLAQLMGLNADSTHMSSKLAKWQWPNRSFPENLNWMNTCVLETCRLSYPM